MISIQRPLINKSSSRVRSWFEIKRDACEILNLIRSKSFEGYWKDAHAISHVQVTSNNPKRYFVVSDEMSKIFSSHYVINLKILKKEYRISNFEGCMSFPFRKGKSTYRYLKIKVLYWVPFLNLFLIPKIKVFKELPAFICQHENDHANGVNMYGL